MSKPLVTMPRSWLLFVIYAAWFIGMMMGAWATVIDARRHGYNVPHLWEMFEKDGGKQ